MEKYALSAGKAAHSLPKNVVDFGQRFPCITKKCRCRRARKSMSNEKMLCRRARQPMHYQKMSLTACKDFHVLRKNVVVGGQESPYITKKCFVGGQGSPCITKKLYERPTCPPPSSAPPLHTNVLNDTSRCQQYQHGLITKKAGPPSKAGSPKNGPR